jgi:hypothetical protein
MSSALRNEHGEDGQAGPGAFAASIWSRLFAAARSTGVIAFGGVVLCWPALVNGYPLLWWIPRVTWTRPSTLGLFALLLPMLAKTPRAGLSGSAALLLLPALAAAMGQIAFQARTGDRLAISPYAPIILLARKAQDGSAKTYLEAHRPERRLPKTRRKEGCATRKGHGRSAVPALFSNSRLPWSRRSPAGGR